jgi:hypothetical protein
MINLKFISSNLFVQQNFRVFYIIDVLVACTGVNFEN